MTLYSQSDTVDLSLSQKKPFIHYLGIEAGIRAFNPESQRHDFIRQGPSSLPNYYNTDGYWEETSTSFISLTAEYRFPTNKVWLSSGIRYSSMNSIVNKIGSQANEISYFYVILKQDNNNSYYYRVKEITEKNQYIGVPLDFRYAPFSPRFFRLYFKVGFDFNLKVGTNQNVDFVESGMNENKEEIIALFDKPNNFYATSTLGVGIQLGKPNKPNFRIEGNLPSFVLTPNASGLVKHNFGGGGTISLLIPLKN